MDFKSPIQILELASTHDCKVMGNSEAYAHGINEIHRVRSGDITFVDTEKYYQKALKSEASFIIIDKKPELPHDKILLITDRPFAVYDAIVKEHRTESIMINGRDFETYPSTTIESNVQIGKNVIIGKNCHIQSHVYIADHTVIGDNVIIQANSSIGTDAFYFKKQEGKYTKWTSGGRVIIEDQVDIGPGCTINRGVSSDTTIGSGTKIDSQVQIGHGVIIGKNCLLAAQVGIAGKSILEDEVVLYGQVGVAQNITIGKAAIVLAKSGVSKNLKGGEAYFGYPATIAKNKYRELAALRNLAKK